jgi:hypothetical protein
MDLRAASNPTTHSEYGVPQKIVDGSVYLGIDRTGARCKVTRGRPEPNPRIADSGRVLSGLARESWRIAKQVLALIAATEAATTAQTTCTCSTRRP